MQDDPVFQRLQRIADILGVEPASMVTCPYGEDEDVTARVMQFLVANQPVSRDDLLKYAQDLMRSSNEPT